MTDHLAVDGIERLLSGAMSPEDRRSVLAHLVSGCPQCRSRAAQVVLGEAPDAQEADESESSEQALSRIILRVRERELQLAGERAAAHELLPGLRLHPPARRMTIVKNTLKFHTWGFCELVLEESWGCRYTNPAEGLHLANLGIAAAQHLDLKRYGEALVEDMRARAFALLGNAHRVVSELNQADAALTQAEAHLARGTGDPIERGRVLELKGDLRTDQRRFDEALGLFDHASLLYKRAGDLHLQARSLVCKGTLLGRSGDPAGATTALRQSLDLIDAERDPRLLLAAQHNLVRFLNDQGETREALELLAKTRPSYFALGDEMNLIRLQWLEGQLNLSLGKTDEAETLLLAVREAFIGKRIPYDVALVSLDLAAVYAEQARTADMKRLAGEMLPIFQSLGIHREAIAAVLVFQQAAEMEAVSSGLIKELAAYFQRASKEPGLAFRAPA